MLYDLSHVTNTLLIRAKMTDVKMSPMKLQKMLYFLYKAYLIRTQQPLFADRFQPWRYGPVIGDVYQAFKDYGPRSITTYYPDPDGICRMLNVDMDPDLKICFNDVWVKYAGHDGIELSQMTHRQGSAWHRAYLSNSSTLKDEDIMNEPSPLEDCV